MLVIRVLKIIDPLGFIHSFIHYSLSSDIVASEARVRVCLSAGETLLNKKKNKLKLNTPSRKKLRKKTKISQKD